MRLGDTDGVFAISNSTYYCNQCRTNEVFVISDLNDEWASMNFDGYVVQSDLWKEGYFSPICGACGKAHSDRLGGYWTCAS